jgi:streptogramin lyase
MRRLILLLFIIASVTTALIIVTGHTKANPTATSGPPDLGFIHEYPVPVGHPFHIVVETSGPPASVWFTLPDANAIGHLVVTSTVDYTFTTLTVPTPNSEPYDLVYDGNNTIWFTENAGNQIGRLTLPAGNIVEYAVPTAGSEPTGIDLSPDGRVWFLQRAGNKLAVFNPNTSQFQEFPYESAGGQLEDVAVLDNTHIWLTAPALNRVSEYRVDEDDFAHVPVISGPGGTLFPPGDMVIGDGRTWISAPSQDWVGVYAPGTLSFWEWVNAWSTGGQPTGLAFSSPDNLSHIWYVETAGNRAGKFVTDAQANISYYWAAPLPTPDSQPRHIAVGANEHAWITEMGSGKIAEWRPPTSFYHTFLPVVLRP